MRKVTLVMIVYGSLAADNNHPFFDIPKSVAKPEDDGILPETMAASGSDDHRWTELVDSAFYPEWILAQLRGNMYRFPDPELVRKNAADAMESYSENKTEVTDHHNLRRRMSHVNETKSLDQSLLDILQNANGISQESETKKSALKSKSEDTGSNPLMGNSVLDDLLANLVKGNTEGMATDGNQVSQVFNEFLKSLNSMVVNAGTLVGVTTKAPTPSEQLIKSFMSIIQGFQELGSLGMQALNITDPLQLIKIPIVPQTN